MPDGTGAARTLRTARELVGAGLIAAGREAAIGKVAERYAVAIPPALAALIGDAADPIGRQFVPDEAELETVAGESADPIADEALSPIKGIVRRYPDRALLKPILACPVYCRSCFRREQVGPDGGVLGTDDLAHLYAWLRARPAIREVILTGGGALAAPLAAAARRDRLGTVHTPISRRFACIRACPSPRPGGSPKRWRAHFGRLADVGRGARQPRGRDHRGAARRHHGAGRLLHGVPVLGRSCCWPRQRQRGGAGRPSSRHDRRPHQALLPTTSSTTARPARRGFTCRSRAGARCSLPCADGSPATRFRPTWSSGREGRAGPIALPRAWAAARSPRMKQQANLIRAGQVIEHEGRRWTVLKQQIITPGKGGAFIQVEMRDLNRVTRPTSAGAPPTPSSG